MLRRPPRSTPTYTLLPYTTLFRARTLPSTREEAGRWSDLAALPALAETQPSGSAGDASGFFLGCGGPRLLFVDGVYQADRSSPGPVTVGAIDASAGDHPLGRLAEGKGWRLARGRDHAPGPPVEIVHLSTGGTKHLAARIDMDDDAQASIIETYAGEGWVNRLTAIRLGRCARAMRAVRLVGGSGFQSLTVRAGQAAGASI